MPNHLPIGDPSSFMVNSTASWLPVCSTASCGPVGSVSYGSVTVTPNTGGCTTTHTIPYVNTPNYGGMVWASTSSFPFTIPEWTHRIWFNGHWTYYMQTSNEAEDILMNKRKIKQSCLLS